MAHLSGKERSDYVRGMFDRIAGRYDLLNRLISGGQDMKWRRFVAEAAELPAGGRMLDIAAGTGDIAFEALKLSPGAQVVGADFALEMMRVGKGREPYGRRVAWTGADALALPYADGSFDAVASGYLMRNVIDIPQALAEQRRVLKPGGRIVILDTSRAAEKRTEAHYPAAFEDRRTAARSADRRGGGRRCLSLFAGINQSLQDARGVEAVGRRGRLLRCALPVFHVWRDGGALGHQGGGKRRRLMAVER